MVRQYVLGVATFDFLGCHWTTECVVCDDMVGFGLMAVHRFFPLPFLRVQQKFYQDRLAEVELKISGTPFIPHI